MAYRELPTTGPLLACPWTNEGGARTHRILPDACVVAGPATQAQLTTVGGDTFGVRFRIGAAGAALGLPASELLDQRVPLEDVWGDVPDVADVNELARAVLERGGATDTLVRAAATGTPRSAIGIGDRQLRRRFLDAVGCGPKTLERILAA
jgi:hypothetical protein